MPSYWAAVPQCYIAKAYSGKWKLVWRLAARGYQLMLCCAGGFIYLFSVFCCGGPNFITGKASGHREATHAASLGKFPCLQRRALREPLPISG